MRNMITMGEFIVKKQADYPTATGELTSLLSSIRLAAKVVNREINKAGLADIIGSIGAENVQGEVQQKLDVYANERFKAALEARGEVCGMASEEEEDFVSFDSELSSLQVRGADRPPRRLLQHRRQRLGRDHLLHLPPGQQTGRRGHSGGLPAAGSPSGRGGLRGLRLLHHAGLHHRLWGQRLHL